MTGRKTMSEDYLAHYGVLGMKWGVRKKTESSGGGGLRSVEEKKKIGEVVNAEAFKKERAKAEKAAEKERKKHESELKKAAKAAAAAAKKAASAAKRGAKAASEKHAANKAKRAQEAAERARKKLENQKLREARQAEAERKKKQREAERAEKKAAKEAEKKQKELEKQRVPKGGITAALRKEAPRHLSSTDLIEQNKRLNLEKQNYELKEKLKEYENQNRSVLAKTADLFVDEARKNLTKYAARTATDMLTAALDSKLKGTEYAGVAKMAKDSFNLDAILKNSMDKKK
nr:MAG TPA: Structural protein [Caudoviricetes sp.]